jgi:hypothetical protein
VRNLHPFSDSLSENCQKFVTKLQESQWNKSLTIDDVGTLIDSRRSSKAVVKEALENQIIQILDDKYELTNTFKQIIQGPGNDSRGVTSTRRRRPRSSGPSKAKPIEKPKSTKEHFRDILQETKPVSKTQALKEKRREKREARIAKARAVVAQNKGHVPTLKLEDQLQRAKAFAIAKLYEEKLAIYCRKPVLRFVKHLNTQDETIWLRAALLADQLQMSYELFIKAQFHYFDKWFSKSPRPYEIATSQTGKTDALERARMYLNEVSAGTINPNSEVLNKSNTPFKVTYDKNQNKKVHFETEQISKSIRFTQSDFQLRSLMKNYQTTDEAVLRVFAKGAQASLYFDREWLEENQTYQRLKNAGEI